MERYTRVFTSKNNLYTLGSPIILSAGALLKDNQTGKILAQLKIRSIADKKIKALMLNVSPFDVAGVTLGEDVSFEYLDLNAARDEEFGRKTLISLPNISTRSFDVTVTKVIFEDNCIWENDQKFTLTVSEPTSLASILQDDELLEQYDMHFNQTAAKAEKVFDLWYCACGALNHQEESKCPKCGNELDALLACDFDMLKSECNERLAKEKLEQEAKETEEKAIKEAEKMSQEQAAKSRKHVMSVVIAMIIAVIATFLVITKIVIPVKGYNAAVALMNEGNYEEAIYAFKALDGYKDSAEQISICENSIKDAAYDFAVNLMGEGKYEEAIAALEALDGYKDSEEQIDVCNKNSSYDNAIKLMNEGKYEEAIAAFEALDGYKDSADKIIECNYGIAVELKNAGRYEDAILAFRELDGYKDSSGQIENCKQLILTNARVGSYVYFGAYEQDNDSTNGKEDIEWLVLAEENNKILLTSRYALDCKHHNSSWLDTTWETSQIRTWLNESFLNDAFSEDEQTKISSTSIKAEKNLNYNTDQGKDTNDKVFLLSISEVEKYFASDEARLCVATAYALANGSESWEVITGQKTVQWWLRTGGQSSYDFSDVLGDGSIRASGNGVIANDSVRPAMWIDLNAIS